MSHPPEPVDTFSLLRAREDDPPNIRALRIVVLAMGGLMVLGFGAVIARIVYLTTRQPVLEQSPPASVAGAGGSAANATPSGRPLADISLALPLGAKVQSQSLSGNRVSVHYVADTEEAIVIVDLETGQPVSRVRIPARK